MANRHSASRRAFLSASAAVAAHVWIPRPVKGYEASEVTARLSGSQSAVGISKWDLDTPALCVDLDRLERNIASMQAAVKRFGLATRPHAKTHRAPISRRSSWPRGPSASARRSWGKPRR